MKKIRSYVFLPPHIELAEALADALDDRKSLSFYLACARDYPKEYLLDVAGHVCALPDQAIYTTRAKLFTSIVTKSNMKLDERSWG